MHQAYYQKVGTVRVALHLKCQRFYFLINYLGGFKYAETVGLTSFEARKPRSIEKDTILALASSTKLMTAICTLQCVERGLLVLDQDVSPLLPEVGKIGIIPVFDDVTGRSVTTLLTRHVTLR